MCVYVCTCVYVYVCVLWLISVRYSLFATLCSLLSVRCSLSVALSFVRCFFKNAILHADLLSAPAMRLVRRFFKLQCTASFWQLPHDNVFPNPPYVSAFNSFYKQHSIRLMIKFVKTKCAYVIITFTIFNIY